MRFRRPKHLGNLTNRVKRGKISKKMSEYLFTAMIGKTEYYFKKEDSTFYKKPAPNTRIRAIYFGPKGQTFPMEVYDLKWRLYYSELKREFGNLDEEN